MILFFLAFGMYLASGIIGWIMAGFWRGQSEQWRLKCSAARVELESEREHVTSLALACGLWQDLAAMLLSKHKHSEPA